MEASMTTGKYLSVIALIIIGGAVVGYDQPGSFNVWVSLACGVGIAVATLLYVRNERRRLLDDIIHDLASDEQAAIRGRVAQEKATE
jgi:hypothetical protein